MKDKMSLLKSTYQLDSGKLHDTLNFAPKMLDKTQERRSLILKYFSFLS